jgi:hypothetical protein
MTGCIQNAEVEPGHEGVVVKHPVIFGHGGVSPEPIPAGSIWIASSTKVVAIPLQPYTIKEKMKALSTLDNGSVNIRYEMVFQNLKGKTPILYEKFGKKVWYKTKVQGLLRELTRDYVKQYSMYALCTDYNILRKLQNEAITVVNNVINTNEIPVEMKHFRIDQIQPPKELHKAYVKRAIDLQLDEPDLAPFIQNLQ